MATGGGGGAAVRAGGAFVELYADDSKLAAGLRGAQARVGRYAQVVAAIGAGAAVAAIGRQTVEFSKDTAYVGEVAKALKTPVEAMTGLFGIMQAAGSSLKESIESVSQFGTAINKAVEGKGEEAAELFKILGRSADDFKKMDAAEGIYQMFASLEKVNDPLDRTRALSLAFGTDGMKLLLPMLNMTNAQLRERATWFAQSAGDVETARRTSVAYSEAVAKVSRAWEQVLLAVAPAVEVMAEAVSAMAGVVKDFAANNRTLTLVIVGVIAAVAVVTAGLAAFGAVSGLVAVGVGALVSVLAFVKAAVVGAVGLLLTKWGILAAALAAVGIGAFDVWAIFGVGAKIISSAWEGIVAAVGNKDLSLAGKIAVAGLAAAWADGMAKLQQGWNWFKATFVDAWHDAVTAVELAFVGMVGRLRGLLDSLGAKTRLIVGTVLRVSTLMLPVGRGLGGEAADLLNDPKFNQKAMEKDILGRRNKEQDARNTSRANAALGAAIRAAFATQRLTELVDQAKNPKKPEAAAGGYSPLAYKLDKAAGAFLQGASAPQIFGGSKPADPVLDENRKQTNELKQVVVNTGNMAEDLKRLASGFVFQ